ncbi:MAG: Smr/MutS family protein [Verrucomicrobiota bacterium]|nr:Smr/MutS family protein [Verrucomicrobiota bacterium]
MVFTMNSKEEPPANGPEPVEIPIDGVLDLHSFRPREVKDLVLDYLDECQKRGICTVRIVHGKGIGALKRTVHALLSRHPAVIDYHLDSALFSGDGATIVHLRLEGPETSPERKHG